MEHKLGKKLATKKHGQRSQPKQIDYNRMLVNAK
jgi:hypothetical protein